MAKVLVGMSGGVDSAVAAYLLKAEGFEVVGVTIRTWPVSNDVESGCCDIEDARRTARKLGIKHYVFNCVDDFEQYVVEPFILEYISGRTPNPCVICNRYVKWQRLLYYAKVLSADYVATGHYASIVRLENGRYTIRKADEENKDQSYMLYRLTQNQLAVTLMPLGRFSKQEVRNIAFKAGLLVADKPDSQDICFRAEEKYAEYAERHPIAKARQGGRLIDEQGKFLGYHKGILHYTIGQRKGLGVSLGRPAYVIKICPDTQEVILGNERSLYHHAIVCTDLNFLTMEGMSLGERMYCKVKVRYRHRDQDALIEQLDADVIKISFKTPVKAPAPGQSAVFYDVNHNIIGGGVIKDVI